MDEHQFFSDKIVALFEKHKLTSLIDYGCGDGELLKKIQKLLNANISLYGIDYFNRFPEDKRPESSDRLKFVDKESDEFNDLLKNPRAALIISTWALHHFKYPQKEFKTMHSMLTGGGLVFLVDFLFANESNGQRVKNLFSFVDEAYLAFKGSFHRHHYTLEEARDLMDATSFEIVSDEIEQVPEDHPENEEMAEHFKKHLEQRIASFDTVKPPKLLKDYFTMQYSKIIELIDEHGFDHGPFFLFVLRKK